MNGRCCSDQNIGKFTCDSSSVVDYVACSPLLFNYCTQFVILEFDSLLSDKHTPINFNLVQINNTSLADTNNIINTLENNSEQIMHVNWTYQQKPLFISNIVDKSIEEALTIIKETHEAKLTQETIDLIVLKVGDIFKSSAMKSNIIKFSKPNNRKVKRKLDRKPWFNNNCENYRSNYLQAKNKFRNNKNPSNLLIMKTNSKLYKKTLRKEYALYHRHLNTKL